ncbi:putative aldouronate transport system permease protein [Cellulosimicrobium cellulans]|jgi:putative aldouronate transport system permease protein|uniref:Protein lplB n=1 Tax=Cellulosimicrobium cellulans TaxID=1710 RepID=A0A1Y0HXT1_CELCE|nr:ABC transporter permease subunit [Cellulosimicrobium cellulans]ARU52115.1 protein lplB [Cellulosimicrobium cellulans]MBM7818680.1 putative aldouronate transport system permease protein [Cellulosimicrobium cellulans]
MTLDQGPVDVGEATTVASAVAAAEHARPGEPAGDDGGRARRAARRRRAGSVPWRVALRKDWRLYTFLVVPVLFLLVFRYLPMLGNVIAFRRFRPGGSVFGDEWVGFRYFEMFIQNQQFWQVFWNTVILGLLTLLICFPLPIVFALLLNELRSRRFKKIVQTVSYLPHFMSIVIVAGLVLQLTSVNGTVNQIVEAFGGDPVAFMQQPEWFRTIYVSSEVWQTVGWGTILYLAALTTIDDQLYEASRIDGANRWQQTWHITLPGIRPTMMVLLILNIGSFMAVGFEKVLLLQNPLVYSTGDVISTYLYRVGIQSAQFSYGTAIGLFEALIGLVLVLSANAVSRRLTGASLW